MTPATGRTSLSVQHSGSRPTTAGDRGTRNPPEAHTGTEMP
jgi:hypothetical protein